jgi:hypothetical protein
MRQFFIKTLSLLLITFASVLNAQVGSGNLSDTNIKYVGRWDKGNNNYHSYWGGAYFKVAFTGTSLKIKLAAPADIYVNIDKKGYKLYKGATGIVDLTTTQLSNGNHNAVVAAKYKDDEIQFQGLVLSNGAKTLNQNNLSIIEFIGDSITSGQSTEMQNLASYSWLVGEQLGLDHTQISYPAISLVNGYVYDTPWAVNWGHELQYFSTRPSKYDPNKTPWNYKTYVPKILVINLGTNDRNTKVPDDVFENSYYNFMKKLHSQFPNAEIFAMRTLWGTYAQQVQNAVNKLTKEGDSRVHYINTDGWISKPADYADNAHPNDAGHAKITKKLIDIIKPYLIVNNLSNNEYDNIKSTAFSSYPNPSKGKITIQNDSSDTINIVISDISGRIKFETLNFTNKNIELDLTGKLNPGIYFIKLENGNKVETSKIIIE